MNRSNKVKLELSKIDETKKVFNAQRNEVSKNINVNAVKNPQTNLWHLMYDAPAVTPENLKQEFTSFGKLLNFVNLYYGIRNLKIKDMKDIENG